MEKTSTREEVASRLKEKEDEINRHLDALQEEVARTRADIKSYLTSNPWIPLAGSVAAGILVGLVLGRKSKKARHQELLDEYMDRLAEIARQAGASEREVGALLRDALRESIPPVVFTASKEKSSGLGSKLIGIAADMAIGFARKSLVHALEDRFQSPTPSENPENPDRKE